MGGNMQGLVTEVQEDGSQEITEVSQASNFEIQTEKVQGNIATDIPTDSLSKLFKRKLVLYVTTEDGEKIPFVYKRIDPGMLLLAQGSPLALDTNIVETAQSVADSLREAQQDSDEQGNPPTDKVSEIMQNSKTQDLFRMAQQLRKNVIQTGTISPEITDELYDKLDDEILNALHDAITGGVTSNNDLVQYFR